MSFFFCYCHYLNTQGEDCWLCCSIFRRAVVHNFCLLHCFLWAFTWFLWITGNTIMALSVKIVEANVRHLKQVEIEALVKIQHFRSSVWSWGESLLLCFSEQPLLCPPAALILLVHPAERASIRHPVCDACLSAPGNLTSKSPDGLCNLVHDAIISSPHVNPQQERLILKRSHRWICDCPLG